MSNRKNRHEPAPVIAEIAVEPVAELVEQAPVAVDLQKAAEIEIAVPPVAVEESAPLDLDKTLAESGLVLVQTTAPAVVAQPEPPPKLGRPRKQVAVEASSEAPLVMVETQK